MLTRRRAVAAALALGLLAGLLLAAAPAVAAPSTDDPEGSAGTSGRDTLWVGLRIPGRPAVERKAPRGGGGADTGCVYTYANDTVPGEPARSGAGGYYYVDGCFDAARNGQLVWVADNAAGATPLIDPAVLAQQALAQLQIPAPRIHTSPSLDKGAVVNFPTWMWVDGTSWRTFTRTVSAGPVTVTATATPKHVRWVTGDGERVTCAGPGTPYQDGVTDPGRASPDCGHVFTRSSASAPGHRFTMTATATYAVTWTADGAAGGGNLPDLTPDGTAALRVAEYQSLNTSR
jgi:hypothetical protein